MKRGTARLSEVATHIIQPAGIVSTGWPSVERTCAQLDLGFDCWQEGAGRLIVAKGADGYYAADTVVISIPRQVGKTYLVGAIVFALCLIRPGLTVIWTAHRFKTASEVFGSMAAMARRPKLAMHISAIRHSGDDKSILFANGSRILFGARERGFGRGFADLDVLVLDEGQILTEAAMDDLTPATNVAENPLIILTGTPPKPKDPSEVFTRFRREALAGDSTDVLYIELSANPKTDPLDRNEWRRFNPSYPHRTPERAMLRMHKNLSAESFEREARGIWDELVGGVISATLWRDLRDTDARVTGEPSFGLDIAPDQSWACLSVAGRSGDGWLAEITQREGVLDHREGIEWIIPRAKQLRASRGSLRLVIAAASAAMALKPGLEAVGVEVDVVPSGEVAAACGFLYAQAAARTLKHSGQVAFADAIASSRKDNDAGEGQWKWHRRRSGSDITPTYAATLALWRANKHPEYDPLDSIG